MADEKEVNEVKDAKADSATAQPIKEQDPKLPAEWVTRKTLELEVRTSLRQEYEQLLALWKSTELADLETKNKEIIAEGLKKLHAKILEEQKPPSHEEIQTLLQQEYETFTVPLEMGETQKTFTLVELPQAAERKFYSMFKTRLLDKANELQAITQAGMDMPFEQKLRAVMNLFDDTFDVLAESVVICLNPYGEESTVTKEWVQTHISSNRQWNIVEAQIGVNKLKDFFSKISRSGQAMTTMTSGVNFQQLQQLVR